MIKTKPSNRLPSEYQEVEYVETTGYRYIDTNYNPLITTKIEAEFAHNETTLSDNYLFGVCSTSSGNVFSLITRPSEVNASSLSSFNNKTETFNSYSKGTKIYFSYTKGSVNYGHQWTYSYPSVGGPNRALIFLGYRDSSGISATNTFSGKIWYFRIWNTSDFSLVKEYIPCYRKSDNVVGFYETVGGTFTSGEGTGEPFTSGPIVLSEVKKIMIKPIERLIDPTKTLIRRTSASYSNIVVDKDFLSYNITTQIAGYLGYVVPIKVGEIYTILYENLTGSIYTIELDEEITEVGTNYGSNRVSGYSFTATKPYLGVWLLATTVSDNFASVSNLILRQEDMEEVKCIKTPKLPKEYQEVEYIENEGLSYIDTGLYPLDVGKYEFDLTFEATNSGTNSSFFAGGYYNTATTGTLNYCPLTLNSSRIVGYGYNGGWYYTSGFTWNIGDRHKIVSVLKKGEQTIKIDGVTVVNTTGLYERPDVNITIPLFWYQYNTQRLSGFGWKGKVYSVKIYGNTNNLIRDYVPCLKKETNEIGLYDLVTKVFYANAGNSPFTKGNDTTTMTNVYGSLSSDYQEVEYVESDGNQYIDTGLKPTSNTKIEVEGCVTTGEGFIIGNGFQGNYVNISIQILNSTYYAARLRNASSGNATVTSSVTTGTTLHKFVVSKADGFSIDNTLIGSFSTSYNYTATTPLYMFAWYGGSGPGNFSKSRISYCKIWENGTLIRDYVACYRKSDGKPGMYDKLNNKFYMNKGDGEFTKGSNV